MGGAACGSTGRESGWPCPACSLSCHLTRCAPLLPRPPAPPPPPGTRPTCSPWWRQGRASTRLTTSWCAGRRARRGLVEGTRVLVAGRTAWTWQHRMLPQAAFLNGAPILLPAGTPRHAARRKRRPPGAAGSVRGRGGGCKAARRRGCQSARSTGGRGGQGSARHCSLAAEVEETHMRGSTA